MSSTYSKRNHVWQLIRQLINQRDVHYSVAIDTIYEVYGNISFTKIIKAIQRDARAGGIQVLGNYFLYVRTEVINFIYVLYYTSLIVVTTLKASVQNYLPQCELRHHPIPNCLLSSSTETHPFM